MRNAFVKTLFSFLCGFWKKYGTRITVPLLLLILSCIGYTICKEPLASGLPVAEKSMKYIFPAIALLSIVASILQRYFLSLLPFIGYYAGLTLALFFTKKAVEADLILWITFSIFCILSVWGEVFSVLLPKWNAERIKRMKAKEP